MKFYYFLVYTLLLYACSNGTTEQTTASPSAPVDSPLNALENDTVQPVLKLHDSLSLMAVPASILEQIRNAPFESDLVGVPASGYTFSGQILKCKVLSFENMGQLKLTNLNVPWIAIVAEQINLGPKEEVRIEIISSNASVTDGASYPTPGKAPTGNSGDACNNGNPGINGVNGSNGGVPSSDMSVPVLYVFTSAVRNEPGNTPPYNYKLKIYAPGIRGGRGGHGQDGGDGGNGGEGGPSKWSGLFCDCGAGSGGNGGNGGIGGKGTRGGNGGAGGTVYLGGTDSAINIFTYTALPITKGGEPGEGGFNGNNGNGGSGGPRGRWNGGCKGGSEGNGGRTEPDVFERASPGEKGPNGKSFFTRVDMAYLLNRN
jgi:hypothetical protein